MTNNERETPTPAGVRRLWQIGLAVLGVVVLLQLAVPVRGRFGMDGFFGFYAAFGFMSCVAMVILARILGWWLRRDDGYYSGKRIFLWTATPDEPERPKYEKIDA